MKKEKKHILCSQFKNRSTFALDGRINGVKDMVNADVYTAASRRMNVPDGINDSPIAGFVKSCFPPPPINRAQHFAQVYNRKRVEQWLRLFADVSAYAHR